MFKVKIVFLFMKLLDTFLSSLFDQAVSTKNDAQLRYPLRIMQIRNVGISVY